MTFGYRHLAASGQAVAVSARHAAPAGRSLWVRSRISAFARSALPVSASHHVGAGPTLPRRARHALDHGASLRVPARLSAPSAQIAPVGASHYLPAQLSGTNPIRARHVLVSSAASGEVRVLYPSPALRWAGGEAAPLSVRLTADQGSALWLADVELSEAGEYAGLAIGAAIEIRIGDDVWALIIDEKLRERPAGYRVKAVSPLALHGAPWSVPRALGPCGLARATCEALLGQVIAWSLPDWALPSAASAIEATPLELCRQIVAAVGGVLESAPDGSVIARPASQVSPPTAVVEGVALLTDADLYGHDEGVGSPLLADRFVVTSGADAALQAIQIEIERDASDEHVRTVLAYPHPWRDVVLAHTGDAAVLIGERAEVWRAAEESLEIVAGAARAKYPVGALDASAYRYVDLGAVTVDGYAFATATPAYSLLDVRYRARAWQWRVEHPRVESIQFLAMEP
jgi:hypothetical protein